MDMERMIRLAVSESLGIVKERDRLRASCSACLEKVRVVFKRCSRPDIDSDSSLQMSHI